VSHKTKVDEELLDSIRSKYGIETDKQTTFSRTRDGCIEAIRLATEQLGHEPARLEYQRLDILPTVEYIVRLFGTWDDAVQCATR
jgi:hypothetical protein